MKDTKMSDEIPSQDLNEPEIREGLNHNSPLPHVVDFEEAKREFDHKNDEAVAIINANISEIKPEEEIVSTDPIGDVLREAERRMLDVKIAEQAQIIAARTFYAKDVEALAVTNSLLASVILSAAEELNIEMQQSNYTLDGQFIPIRIRVQKEGAYTLQQMSYISVLVKKALERKTVEAQHAIDDRAQLEKTITDGKALLDTRNKQLQQLQTTLRHPTIYTKSFILAYLNDKGNFVYVGNKDNLNYPTKDFNEAERYESELSAISKLTELLKNSNHVVKNIHQYQVYNASLILSNTSNDQHLNLLRENAQKYENTTTEKPKAEVKSKFNFAQSLDNKSKPKKKKERFIFKMKKK